jgi:hypothetical protein
VVLERGPEGVRDGTLRVSERKEAQVETLQVGGLEVGMFLAYTKYQLEASVAGVSNLVFR